MKIKNLWSLAALVSIIFAVTACSGNPVDEKKVVSKSTVTAKKATKSRAKQAIKTTKNRPNSIQAKKVLLSTSAKTVKSIPLTRAQSNAKKRSIASLGKSRKEQARLKYLSANKAKKYKENQRLKGIKVARNNAIKRNVAKRSIHVANWNRMQSLGLDRFTGSQEDKPVVNWSARRARAAALRAQQAQKQAAQVQVSRSQAAAIRAKQAQKNKALMVANRARQQVKTRSRQPVVTRAKQPARTRSRQPVKTRAQQPVQNRAKQPVRARATQYAARTKAPVKKVARYPQNKRNIRKVSATRRPVAVRRATPRVRQAVSRIDPNVSFGHALSGAAIERTKQRVRYDGKYVKIGYPWGDVPKSIGVCTDVVIRAYRRLGIDLQQEVHQDISKDFYAYPNLVKWGLTRPDPNIDHRRVYNLQAFFKRHKAELPRSRNPRDYKVGDLVTWMVGPNFPHIGVVVNKPSKADRNRLMIAHNIGYGPKVEDILFRFPMTGHYRYTHQNRKINPALLFAKTPVPASVVRRQRNKSLSYSEVLQASKILLGKVQARTLPSISDLLVKNDPKARPQEKIMLAHLDATIFGKTSINQAALKALLK